jgi:hypothetical protein
LASSGPSAKCLGGEDARGSVSARTTNGDSHVPEIRARTNHAI